MIYFARLVQKVLRKFISYEVLLLKLHAFYLAYLTNSSKRMDCKTAFISIGKFFPTETSSYRRKSVNLMNPSKAFEFARQIPQHDGIYNVYIAVVVGESRSESKQLTNWAGAKLRR